MCQLRRSPVSEERLINYPASAQLTDIFGNVYSVNGYCTELVNGSGATTNFRVASYVSGSTAAQRAEAGSFGKAECRLAVGSFTVISLQQISLQNPGLGMPAVEILLQA